MKKFFPMIVCGLYALLLAGCSSDEPQNKTCVEAFNEAGEKMYILDCYPKEDVTGLSHLIVDGNLFQELKDISVIPVDVSLLEASWLQHWCYDVEVPAEGAAFSLTQDMTRSFEGDMHSAVSGMGSFPIPEMYLAPTYGWDGGSFSLNEISTLYSCFPFNKGDNVDSKVPAIVDRQPLSTPFGKFSPGNKTISCEIYANKSGQERMFVIMAEPSMRYDWNGNTWEDSQANTSSDKIYLRFHQPAAN